MIVVFFVIFTAASLLIPNPMFPGSLLSGLVGADLVEYSLYLSALINGVFYGGLLGLVFFALSKRLGQEE